MHPNSKTAIKCLLILILTVFLYSNLAFAQDNPHFQPDPAAMAVDLVLIRPLGFGALIVGSVLFVVSSPFSALGGNIDEAYAVLIEKPAVYTFERPLGHFDDD